MGGNALDALYGMGSSMMGVEQADLDRQYGDYQFGTKLPFDLYNSYMNPYANLASFSGKGHFQQQQSNMDKIGQVLGIAGAAKKAFF